MPAHHLEQKARQSLSDRHGRGGQTVAIGLTQPIDDDARLVVDIDLSILGQAEQVYDVFERSVREEYKWVPWFLYRRKRIEILRSFLERESIYGTDRFRQRYESGARSNLDRAIRRLEQ